MIFDNFTCLNPWTIGKGGFKLLYLKTLCTGKVSLERRYPVTEYFTDCSKMVVRFIRKNIDQWSQNYIINQQKKMSGVQFSWHFEDGNGSKIELGQTDRFITHPIESVPNRSFIKWMNIFFYASHFLNIPLANIFQTVKYAKEEWVYYKGATEKRSEFDFIYLAKLPDASYYSWKHFYGGLFTSGQTNRILQTIAYNYYQSNYEKSRLFHLHKTLFQRL